MATLCVVVRVRPVVEITLLHVNIDRSNAWRRPVAILFGRSTRTRRVAAQNGAVGFVESDGRFRCWKIRNAHRGASRCCGDDKAENHQYTIVMRVAGLTGGGTRNSREGCDERKRSMAAAFYVVVGGGRAESFPRVRRGRRVTVSKTPALPFAAGVCVRFSGGKPERKRPSSCPITNGFA